MGYSVYLARVSKKNLNKIKNLSYSGLKKSLTDEEFLHPAQIFPNKVFELGEAINTDKLSEFMTPLFKESTQEHFEDDLLMALSKEGLEKAIALFHSFIVENKERQLSRAKNIIKKDGDEYEKRQFLQQIELDCKNWKNYKPYSLNKDRALVDSLNAEYLIFELVLVYRNFNWDEDVLVIMGH